MDTNDYILMGAFILACLWSLSGLCCHLWMLFKIKFNFWCLDNFKAIFLSLVLGPKTYFVGRDYMRREQEIKRVIEALQEILNHVKEQSNDNE